MGHSRAEKAENHDRILALASRQVRQDGLAAINVAALMQAAGLTHGGFYRHFASRADLLAQAVRRAFADGAARAAGGGSGERRSLPAFVRGYLSRSHRDEPADGCAIAALAGDLRHADQPARVLLDEQVRSSAAAASAALAESDPAAREGDGLAIMSTLVGALILARAVDDRRLSDQILQSAREFILARNFA